MAVEVCTASIADADELAAIAAATFPLACPPSADPGDIAACIAENLSAEQFAGYLGDPQRRVLAARRAGRIIGYAMLIRGDADVELSKIYVLADHHRSGAAAAPRFAPNRPPPPFPTKHPKCPVTKPGSF